MKSAVILLFAIFIFSCKENKNTSAVFKQEIGQLPYFNSADFTPEWNKAEHKIPNFSFLNQNGDTINNDTYTGKIYVADFFFTICPGICPRLTKNMNDIQEHYKNDDEIMLLSHSVMPWHDSVEVLATYAETNNVNNTKWNLVTGDKNEIYTLARNGYFADEDFGKTQEEMDFIHTENFVLVDKKGYIRGVYNGTLEVDVMRLIRHIKILKNEI